MKATGTSGGERSTGEIAKAWEAFASFSPGGASGVRVFFAPGRVNLIGEHIDYNGGYVLPAAIEQGTWVLVRPREDRLLRMASTAFPEVVACSVDELTPRAEDGFANYPKGVVWALKEAGLPVQGADLLFHGNLPAGAGLSSSASIQMATAIAFNEICGGGSAGGAHEGRATARLSLVRLAQLAQRSENEFVGVQCGIMDQFAVAMGVRDHALLLDCGSLQHRPVPVRIQGYRMVITNTCKPRSLTESKYNERRQECESALAALRQSRPGLRHLAELSPSDLAWAAELISHPVWFRRVRHVVTENARVLAAARALEAGDAEAFGRLLAASHLSLREDYEVTGLELDALAEAAWEAPGCAGSRMTGAGFGGCTVSFVEDGAVDAFTAYVRAAYERRTGLSPSFYITGIGSGAREVTEEVSFT
ncbi:MAG: galactokinase [Alicyclobacillus sp.]|nr:galactokinase [Alicyclobacillus sp.]